MSKEEFSYLDYIDDFSPESMKKVKQKSGMTVEQLSDFTGFSKDTITGWFKNEDSTRRKIPTRHSWSLLVYMLEAKRKGYDSLSELISSTKDKNNQNSSCK